MGALARTHPGPSTHLPSFSGALSCSLRPSQSFSPSLLLLRGWAWPGGLGNMGLLGLCWNKRRGNGFPVPLAHLAHPLRKLWSFPTALPPLSHIQSRIVVLKATCSPGANQVSFLPGGRCLEWLQTPYKTVTLIMTPLKGVMSPHVLVRKNWPLLRVFHFVPDHLNRISKGT